MARPRGRPRKRHAATPETIATQEVENGIVSGDFSRTPITINELICDAISTKNCKKTYKSVLRSLKKAGCVLFEDIEPLFEPPRPTVTELDKVQCSSGENGVLSAVSIPRLELFSDVNVDQVTAQYADGHCAFKESEICVAKESDKLVDNVNNQTGDSLYSVTATNNREMGVGSENGNMPIKENPAVHPYPSGHIAVPAAFGHESWINAEVYAGSVLPISSEIADTNLGTDILINQAPPMLPVGSGTTESSYSLPPEQPADHETSTRTPDQAPATGVTGDVLGKDFRDEGVCAPRNAVCEPENAVCEPGSNVNSRNKTKVLSVNPEIRPDPLNNEGGGTGSSSSNVNTSNNNIAATQVGWNKIAKSQAGMTLHFFENSAESSEVDICREDVEEEIHYWQFTLMANVIGAKPSLAQMQDFATKNWNHVSAPTVQYFRHGWFSFRFTNQNDMEEVLKGGPWNLGSNNIVLKQWSPTFTKEMDQISTVPIWILFPDLDPLLWSDTVLSKLASRVGKPLYADLTTTTKARLSFARVLVEADLASALPETITLNTPFHGQLIQRVVYEWRPYYCTGSKKLGHTHQFCKLNKAKPIPYRTNWVPKVTAAPSGKPPSHMQPRTLLLLVPKGKEGRKAPLL